MLNNEIESRGDNNKNFEFFNQMIIFEEFYWIHDIHLRTGFTPFCRKEGEIDVFMTSFDFPYLYKKDMDKLQNLQTIVKTLEEELTWLKNQIQNNKNADNINEAKEEYNKGIEKRKLLLKKIEKMKSKTECVKYFINKPKDFIITNEFWTEVLEKILTSEQKFVFNKIKSVDVSYKNEYFSYRINLFLEKGNPAMTCRSITADALDFDTINLPESPRNWADRSSGLIFITGPTWSWKSTTLISLANYINKTYKKHIISIEDPIEYYYENWKSIVSQREVWKDTLSFAQGVKDALREDPDVIIIWEIRDQETMKMALTAADTGHLVLATLHSTSAIKTISRFTTSFEWSDAIQVKNTLSNSLVWIINQRLINYWYWKYFTAYEILNIDPSIWSIIREDRVNQISTYLNIIQKGNQNLVFGLSEAVDKGYVGLSDAVSISYEQWLEDFKKTLVLYLKIRYLNSSEQLEQRLQKIEYLDKVYTKEISYIDSLEENKLTLEEVDNILRWKIQPERLIKIVESKLMEKYNKDIWKVQDIISKIKNYSNANALNEKELL